MHSLLVTLLSEHNSLGEGRLWWISHAYKIPGSERLALLHDFSPLSRYSARYLLLTHPNLFSKWCALIG